MELTRRTAEATATLPLIPRGIGIHCELPNQNRDLSALEMRATLGERITVRDVLEEVYPDIQRSIDTALPQDWVDAVYKHTGVYAPGKIVWAYDATTYAGYPLPTCLAGRYLIRYLCGLEEGMLTR